MADPTEQSWEEEQRYRRKFLEEEVCKSSSIPKWCSGAFKRGDGCAEAFRRHLRGDISGVNIIHASLSLKVRREKEL